MSRANTVGLVPPGAGYSEWAAKYRANADRERAIYLEALERRRAAGLLVVKEYRSGEDYEWDAVADADGDEYDRDGDEGRGLVEL